MLRRRDIISRGERPRSGDGAAVIARGGTRVRPSPFANASSNNARMSPMLAGAVKTGLAAWSARSAAHQLSATTAIQSSRLATWRTPATGSARRVEKPVSRPPGGAIRAEANSMSGRRTSPAKRKTAVRLGRAVEPLQRLAHQPCRAVAAKIAVVAALRSAASSANSPKVKLRRRLMTKPSAVSQSARIDVPAVGGRPDQHRPRGRRGLAHRLLERADRGRAGGDPHAPSPPARCAAASEPGEPAFARRPADWHRPRSAARARPRPFPTPRQARRRRSAAARSTCPGRFRPAAPRR